MIKRRLPLFIAIGWFAYIVVTQIQYASDPYFDIEKLLGDFAFLGYVVLGGVMILGQYLFKSWVWYYCFFCAAVSLAIQVFAFWPLDFRSLIFPGIALPALMILSLIAQKLPHKAL